jgi:hypothetical protein
MDATGGNIRQLTHLPDGSNRAATSGTFAVGRGRYIEYLFTFGFLKQVGFQPDAVCYPVEPHNRHFVRKQLRRRISITPREYVEAHSTPDRFIVAHGHVFPEVEDVVDTRPDYVIVEKRPA